MLQTGAVVGLAVTAAVLRASVQVVRRMRDVCPNPVDLDGDGVPTLVQLPCHPETVRIAAGWRGPVLAVAIAAVVFGTAIAYGLAGRAGRPG